MFLYFDWQNKNNRKSYGKGAKIKLEFAFSLTLLFRSSSEMYNEVVNEVLVRCSKASGWRKRGGLARLTLKHPSQLLNEK